MAIDLKKTAFFPPLFFQFIEPCWHVYALVNVLAIDSCNGFFSV